MDGQEIDGATQLQAHFDRLKAGFSFSTVPSIASRREKLRRLAEAIRAHETEICAAIDADFGTRTAFETRLAEIGVTISEINTLIKNLRKWARPKRMMNIGGTIPGKTYLRYEPKGVVGIISPWNYPFQLAMVPVATAIAGGNRVLLKPSEYTPRTSRILADILAKVFTEDEIVVITGDAEIGAAFSALPFDHLFYTGSTQVGRLVAMAAAKNLTPVTLELGGKSPCLMMPDASPEFHARLVAYGRFINAGQTCVAPDYLLVPKGQATAYADAIIGYAKEFYGEDISSDEYTSIISKRHYDRLQGMITTAQDAGTPVLSSMTLALSEDHRKIAPTVMINPAPDAPVMAEEIFGPILPIIEYDDIDDAIQFITRRDHPLALYVFGKDTKVAEQILARTTSGGAAINATVLHLGVEHLPFGGVGKSGYGAYHGHRGFKEFTHERSVLVFPQLSFLHKALTPPLSKFTKFMADWTIKRKA